MGISYLSISKMVLRHVLHLTTSLILHGAHIFNYGIFFILASILRYILLTFNLESLLNLRCKTNDSLPALIIL